jgi:hypothetical protein
MEYYLDQHGTPWAFEATTEQVVVDEIADANGVTLTAITEQEYVSIINPPPSLSDVMAGKIAELEEAYSSAMQTSVEFITAAGVTATFQADRTSQELLLKATTGFGIYGATNPGFYWLAEDNTKVPFTLADLSGLYLVMLMQGGAAFQRLQDKKDLVRREGVTIAEVQAVVW